MKKLITLLLFNSMFLPALLAQDAETLYKEGKKLRDEKKSVQALEKFKKAVALKPAYTEALYEMGWCQNDTKDYAGAVTSLIRARAAWSHVPKVFFELGYAYQNLDKPDSAIANYERCLQLKPDYSNIHKQMGYVYYNQDKFDKAIQHFALQETSSKTEITDYLYWYRRGYSYNAIKDYTSAKTNLSKSLQYKTDYINTYLELGFACSKLKEDEAAIEWFKKAALIDPKSHIPTNGIAEVYRDNKKNMDEAMNWYKKTLQINSTERKACFGMGYCLNSKSRYSEAIPYLETAIQKEATYTAAYVELGYSYHKTNRNDDALKMFEKALNLNPKNENARFYACLVYIGQKNKTKAQQMVDELKAINSRHTDGLQNRVNAM
jgi:tetratricopeptide (TPR) repeat protein